VKGLLSLKNIFFRVFQPFFFIKVRLLINWYPCITTGKQSRYINHPACITKSNQLNTSSEATQLEICMVSFLNQWSILVRDWSYPCLMMEYF